MPDLNHLHEMALQNYQASLSLTLQMCKAGFMTPEQASEANRTALRILELDEEQIDRFRC